MRHRRRTRKLGWKTAHRQAALRNMVTSLLEHGRIVTTVPRAKEVCRLAERMVTLAKEGGLHSKRQALSVIRSRDVVVRLFGHWREQFSQRNGGYTRIVRMGPRRGDAAMLSVVEMAVESLPKSKSSGRPRGAGPSETIPTSQAAGQRPLEAQEGATTFKSSSEGEPASTDSAPEQVRSREQEVPDSPGSSVTAKDRGDS